MKFAKKMFFSVLLFISFSASADVLLNRTIINKMLDNVQKSVISQNIDEFSIYFTDDSTFTLEMPKHMGGKSTINKLEYIQMLKQGWSMPNLKFDYEVKNIEIDISKDEKSAVVSSVTIEKMKMNGKLIMSSTSHEINNVIISDDKVKIKMVYAKIEINS